MMAFSILILSAVLGVGFRVMYNCLTETNKELHRIEGFLHREEKRNKMRN